MNLSNIRIGTRLLATVGIMLVLTLAVGVTGALSTSAVNERLDNMYEQELVSMEVLDDAKSATYRIRGDVLEHVLAERGDSMQRLAGEIAQQHERIGKRLAEFRATRLSDEEEKLVKSFESAWATYYRSVAERILPLSGSAKKDEAEQLARMDVVDEFRSARDAMNALMDYTLERGKKRHENGAAAAKQALSAIVAISAVALGLGLVMGWLLSRSITRPLAQALDVAQRVSAGDLTVQVSATGRDETGQLLAALGEMTGSPLPRRPAMRRMPRG